MPDAARGYLLRQHDLAWKLLAYHLDDLTTADCLRRPAESGLHVHRVSKGVWRADWPAHEGYALGPSSLAWLTWHVCFWWSMVIEHSFGRGIMSREDVPWPGDAAVVRNRIGQLHDTWRDRLVTLTEAELASTAHARWPFTDRPFGDVVAWVNVELTKSAAEIGYVRFLYGADPPRTETS